MTGISDRKVKSLQKEAQTEGKRKKITVGPGLYINASPKGMLTYQLLAWRDDGKRHWVTLGRYDEMTMKEAQLKALTYCPKDGKTARTFREVFEEWLPVGLNRSANKKERSNIENRIRHHVLPFVGDMDIDKIGQKDVLPIVYRLNDMNQTPTARKVLRTCSAIFDYAQAHDYCENNPITSYVKKAVLPHREEHMSAKLDAEEVGELMRKISSYPYIVVRSAMLFSAYTMARPGEVRHAEWTEIDFEAKTWTIPAEKMKKRREHVVPLSRQVMAILSALKGITGHGRYIFPSNRAPEGGRPMSENTVRKTLIGLYDGKEKITAHGFRSTASTILNEHGFNRDVIEAQLAHIDKDRIRAAYNRADYMKARAEMLQWYADKLDALKISLTAAEAA